MSSDASVGYVQDSHDRRRPAVWLPNVHVMPRVLVPLPVIWVGVDTFTAQQPVCFPGTNIMRQQCRGSMCPTCAHVTPLWLICVVLCLLPATNSRQRGAREVCGHGQCQRDPRLAGWPCRAAQPNAGLGPLCPSSRCDTTHALGSSVASSEFNSWFTTTACDGGCART